MTLPFQKMRFSANWTCREKAGPVLVAACDTAIDAQHARLTASYTPDDCASALAPTPERA